MKLKKEYIILGLVIVALVLYLLFHETDRNQYELPVVPEVASKEINKLEIQRSDNTIVLNKKDNRWAIAPKDYPADANTVDSMVDVLADLTLTALVSESRSYFRYDLSEDKRIGVRAWTGETLSRNMAIGKAAPTYQHTFVLLEDNPNIYHASGSFRSKFDKTVEALRDKAVLTIEKKLVQSIRLTKGEDSQTFTLGSIPVDITEDEDDKVTEAVPPEPKMEWMAADGQKADETTIDSLLGMLTRLKCESYQDIEEKDEGAKADYVIELSGPRTASLAIFAKEDAEADRYPATSSDNDYPFFLAGSQGNNIIEKFDTLLEPTK